MISNNIHHFEETREIGTFRTRVVNPISLWYYFDNLHQIIARVTDKSPLELL